MRTIDCDGIYSNPPHTHTTTTTTTTTTCFSCDSKRLPYLFLSD